MLQELKARIKYNFYCLVMEDGSWDMGAVLWGSMNPLGGKWMNENGVFDTFAEVK